MTVGCAEDIGSKPSDVHAWSCPWHYLWCGVMSCTCCRHLEYHMYWSSQCKRQPYAVGYSSASAVISFRFKLMQIHEFTLKWHQMMIYHHALHSTYHGCQSCAVFNSRPICHKYTHNYKRLWVLC